MLQSTMQILFKMMSFEHKIFKSNLRVQSRTTETFYPKIDGPCGAQKQNSSTRAKPRRSLQIVVRVVVVVVILAVVAVVIAIKSDATE